MLLLTLTWVYLVSFHDGLNIERKFAVQCTRSLGNHRVVLIVDVHYDYGSRKQIGRPPGDHFSPYLTLAATTQYYMCMGKS